MISPGKAREIIETATAKVSASAETIARAVGAAIGIAVVGLVVACIALVMASRGKPAAA